VRRAETGSTLNALRACPEVGRSAAQKAQDREHAAVLIAAHSRRGGVKRQTNGGGI
jgi:hypothetical protein